MALLNRTKDRKFINTWVENFQHILSSNKNQWEMFDKIEVMIEEAASIESKLNVLFLVNETFRNGKFTNSIREFGIKYTEIRWRNIIKVKDLDSSIKFPKIQISGAIINKEEFLNELYLILKEQEFIGSSKNSFIKHFNNAQGSYERMQWIGKKYELYCFIASFVGKGLFVSSSWVKEVRRHFISDEVGAFSKAHNMYTQLNKKRRDSAFFHLVDSLKKKYYFPK